MRSDSLNSQSDSWTHKLVPWPISSSIIILKTMNNTIHMVMCWCFRLISLFCNYNIQIESIKKIKTLKKLRLLLFVFFPSFPRERKKVKSPTNSSIEKKKKRAARNQPPSPLPGEDSRWQRNLQWWHEYDIRHCEHELLIYTRKDDRGVD